MSLKRVAVLLLREGVQGSQNFLLIFAIVVPIVLTLVVSLLFGTLFAGEAKLGIADPGGSRVVRLAQDVEGLIVREYGSAGALREAVAAGAVDVGVVLPPGFDAAVQSGQRAELLVYVWGESLLRHRATLGTVLATLFRQLAGQEPPIEIATTTLGEAAAPWEERLLPFIVLMTLLIGGSMVPATSLVDEKQKRTLSALTATPVSLGEVFVAKGLLGLLLSVAMAVVILALNRAFGSQPLLLLLVLTLGAAMAAAFGVLLGAFVKDINTLFATIKGIGILLYAPALVYLFPEIPQWIGRLFPTYYMIQPMVEITQEGGGWADVAPELAILILLTLVLFGLVALAGRRMRQREW